MIPQEPGSPQTERDQEKTILFFKSRARDCIYPAMSVGQSLCQSISRSKFVFSRLWATIASHTPAQMIDKPFS